MMVKSGKHNSNKNKDIYTVKFFAGVLSNTWLLHFFIRIPPKQRFNLLINLNFVNMPFQWHNQLSDTGIA
jgi:hypothetical protein